jgi:hypothetical protein
LSAKVATEAPVVSPMTAGVPPVAGTPLHQPLRVASGPPLCHGPEVVAPDAWRSPFSAKHVDPLLLAEPPMAGTAAISNLDANGAFHASGTTRPPRVAIPASPWPIDPFRPVKDLLKDARIDAGKLSNDIRRLTSSGMHDPQFVQTAPLEKLQLYQLRGAIEKQHNELKKMAEAAPPGTAISDQHATALYDTRRWIGHLDACAVWISRREYFTAGELLRIAGDHLGSVDEARRLLMKHGLNLNSESFFATAERVVAQGDRAVHTYIDTFREVPVRSADPALPQIPSPLRRVDDAATARTALQSFVPSWHKPFANAPEPIGLPLPRHEPFVDVPVKR